MPPGEFGEKLLVTVLFNQTQPLIRYELNDSLRLTSQRCECGRLFGVVESIQGREEDTLLLPAITQGRVAIQPLVFNRVMDILPVTGWQVIQEPDDGLIVLLSGARNAAADETLVDQLTRSLAEHGARVPRIQMQHVPAIPKTAAGKAPLVLAKITRG